MHPCRQVVVVLVVVLVLGGPAGLSARPLDDLSSAQQAMAGTHPPTGLQRTMAEGHAHRSLWATPQEMRHAWQAKPSLKGLLTQCPRVEARLQRATRRSLRDLGRRYALPQAMVRSAFGARGGYRRGAGREAKQEQWWWSSSSQSYPVCRVRARPRWASAVPKQPRHTLYPTAKASFRFISSGCHRAGMLESGSTDSWSRIPRTPDMNPRRF